MEDRAGQCRAVPGEADVHPVGEQLHQYLDRARECTDLALATAPAYAAVGQQPVRNSAGYCGIEKSTEALWSRGP